MEKSNPSPKLPFESYLKEFPQEIQGIVQSGWRSLSPDRQQRLIQVAEFLPTDRIENMRKLLSLGKVHIDMVLGDRQSIAIVGPANVGKSTLYNKLIADSETPAQVSAIPGTTKTNRTGDASLFSLVDTPGVDAAGSQGLVERNAALEAADQADLLILLFDAVQGIKTGEKRFLEELKRLEKPYLILLNKIDMIPRWEREEMLTKSAQILGIEASQLIPISAQKGENLGQVIVAIAKSEPALIAALGKALPHYRGQLAWRSIFRASSTAASIALTPLPIIDFIPLVTVQALLVLSIARIYNYRITLTRARELLGAMGMGYLGRLAFYELTKLGGPPTWIISVAVATATTIVVGYSAILWFEKGEKLSNERARQAITLIAKRISTSLGQSIRWRKRRPKRSELEEEITIIFDKVREKGIDDLENDEPGG
ncbi:MAG: GTPase [Chloroflexota bacterium]